MTGQLIYTDEFVADRMKHLNNKLIRTNESFKGLASTDPQFRFKQYELLLMKLAMELAERNLYGLCLEQACRIGKKRLLVLPESAYCLFHQEKIETRLKDTILSISQIEQLLRSRIYWYVGAKSCVLDVVASSDSRKLDPILEKHWLETLNTIGQSWQFSDRVRMINFTEEWEFGFPNFRRVVKKIYNLTKRQLQK